MQTADPLDEKQTVTHWTSQTVYWSEIAGPPEKYVILLRETFCKKYLRIELLHFHNLSKGPLAQGCQNFIWNKDMMIVFKRKAAWMLFQLETRYFAYINTLPFFPLFYHFHFTAFSWLYLSLALIVSLILLYCTQNILGHQSSMYFIWLVADLHIQTSVFEYNLTYVFVKSSYHIDSPAFIYGVWL